MRPASEVAADCFMASVAEITAEIERDRSEVRAAALAGDEREPDNHALAIIDIVNHLERGGARCALLQLPVRIELLRRISAYIDLEISAAVHCALVVEKHKALATRSTEEPTK